MKIYGITLLDTHLELGKRTTSYKGEKMELNYRQSVLYSLALKAQSDKAEAMVSINILLDHPAGIGDHSTEDLHKNLNEALSKLADADDRLETLTRYFPELRNSNNASNTGDASTG